MGNYSNSRYKLGREVFECVKKELDETELSELTLDELKDLYDRTFRVLDRSYFAVLHDSIEFLKENEVEYLCDWLYRINDTIIHQYKFSSL